MKFNLTLLLVVTTTLGFSQSGAKFATGGNSLSTGDFLGSTNPFQLDFRTNNILRGSFSTTGVFKVSNLAGTGTRLLQTDASGNIIFLPAGTASQVLYGNGIWGALPTSTYSSSLSCIIGAMPWSMGGDNVASIKSIGTCNNFDFVIKTNGTDRAWFKTDGTVGFGTSIPSNTFGKEYKFHQGALRLSGNNTYGGPMIVFDGGINPYGDWGIEYQATQFAKPGLNFWKPFGSTNATNYNLFLADDGMVGVGTANPTSRFTIDAWQDNAIEIQTSGSKKAISSFNKTTTKETFAVYANGKTIIGDATSTDTMLVVNGIFKTKSLAVSNAFTASKFKLTTTGADELGIGLTTLPSGARIISFGPLDPIELSRTCITPYTGVLARFSDRLIITKSSSPTATSNVFDFRNDSLHGYIDYGYDVSLYPRLIDTIGAVVPIIVPSLKINSVCNGDVDIAKGGGFTSTGRYFEVGSPVRNGAITSNILAINGRVGQRVTASSPYPDTFTATAVPIAYNTQLFVNRNRIHALSVFNTVANPTGEEIFSVYGDGKIQLNTFNHLNKFFVINDFQSPRTNNESFIVYGSGETVINAFAPTNKCFVVNDALYPDAPVESFLVTGQGRTFIGKGRPLATGPSANAMLTVDGLILAKEMRIAITSIHWADYVFENNYKLTELKELEAYIKANKHLPEVPTTEQVKMDGINIAEMNVLLLKKTEELTLYLIEQNKRLEILEKEITLIKAQLKK